MAADPVTVVETYFSKMRAADVSVVELFHDDAVLRGLGTLRSGRREIDAFYIKTIERAGPTPRHVGPMLAAGSRVAAEVMIEVSEALTVHVVDMFEVDEGRIRSLTYFVADYPTEAGA
ncbi:MAG: nuclear transport factor 2 family protein [bacterium]|nr:nuclear transport factor 2 family protein [bacterium]